MSREKGLVLNERDIRILHEVSRWKFCLGRQIRKLADFSGERSCDRRLAKLIEFNYLERRHILYGIPGLYFLGKNAKYISTVKYYSYKLKLDELVHDIAVVDAVLFLCKHFEVPLDAFTSERELHAQDGFSNRKHQPDAVFLVNDKCICLEVEFTPKSKERFTKNIKANFANYDAQIWVVPKADIKIHKMIEEAKIPDVSLIYWETIERDVKRK